MRICKLNDVYNVENHTHWDYELSAEDHIIQRYTRPSKRRGEYGSFQNHTLLTIETEDGEAIIQVLVHPNLCPEYAYGVFATINPQADDFSMTDTEHRDNAPLFVADSVA